jgi:putative DNA primase/helicase
VEFSPEQIQGLERIIESSFEKMMGFPLNPNSPEAFADEIKQDLRLIQDDTKQVAVLWNKLDGLNCTHFGNGERFVVYYKDLVRYLPPFDWWFIWINEEGRWGRDDRGTIYELGKRVVRKIYDEASKAKGEEQRKKLAQWAIHCETPGSVSQMLEVARSTPSIVIMPEILDPDPLLVNLKNGYYSFVDHRMHPHDKRHYFSMLIPIEYDGVASCPRWRAFLDRIFRGNKDKDKIIEFLQRAIGYTLTGDTGERAIFLMHGLGANGKTVFIRVLESLFGDYGAAVSSTTFTTAMSTNVRNDLARLKGKRFVWASENSSDTVLDEEMIKRITGGDTITCRFLFKEEFEYRPNFKIWWVFNHKPKIKDATDSIWDRIYLIPCEERIPTEEQDKHLAEKLIMELPGIFNWATDGYVKYIRDGGLFPPSAVKEATKEYRNDEDALHDFLEEYFLFPTDEPLIASDDFRTPFKEIYDLYKAWSLEQGYKNPWSKKKVGGLLGEKFRQVRTSQGRERVYVGLRPKRMRDMRVTDTG